MTNIIKSRRFPLLLITVAIALLTCTSVADANWSSPCERTAWHAHRACTIDTAEELQLTYANCTNISDWEDRRDCRAEAMETRDEARDECAEIKEAREDLCDLLEEFRYDPDPLLDPDNSFVHPDDVPDLHAANPLLSLEAGLVRVIGSEDEVVVILTTDETREINGVECRIVAELALEIE